MQDRSGDPVFAGAEWLITYGHACVRELGVDILAQGQIAEKPLRERAIPLLLNLVAHEQDARVAGLGHAFGLLYDPATIDTVRKSATHPDENDRCGVVHGLSCYDDQRAIATLIPLSSREDSDVRDGPRLAWGP